MICEHPRSVNLITANHVFASRSPVPHNGAGGAERTYENVHRDRDCEPGASQIVHSNVVADCPRSAGEYTNRRSSGRRRGSPRRVHSFSGIPLENEEGSRINHQPVVVSSQARGEHEANNFSKKPKTVGREAICARPTGGDLNVIGIDSATPGGLQV